jgi:glycosyltransferase involved in cell wall biosynthesis
MSASTVDDSGEFTKVAMSISVIIPAYNEESGISHTLECINMAKNYLRERGGPSADILVVDNASTDRTGEAARNSNVRVIQEAVRGVANARNAGARTAQGDTLVFIDADVVIPETTLWRVFQVMSNPRCIGGAVDTLYQPTSTLVKRYLEAWRALGRLLGMAQGAVQFCRRESFFSLGGYDETFYMGEDVNFYWRLTRKARKQDFHVCFIDDIRVVPSSRRFDQWPLWRILLWTNPIVVLLFRRQRKVWGGWYELPPR